MTTTVPTEAEWMRLYNSYVEKVERGLFINDDDAP